MIIDSRTRVKPPPPAFYVFMIKYDYEKKEVHNKKERAGA